MGQNTFHISSRHLIPKKMSENKLSCLPNHKGTNFGSIL